MLQALALVALLQAPNNNKDVVTTSGRDDLILGAPRTGVTLKVTDKNITGPLVQLGRYDKVLRGSYKRRTVEIQWTDDRVTGQIGAGAPLHLKIRRTDEGLKIDGMLNGVTSHFRLGYGVLDGRIGGCRYTLAVQDGEYQGERTCDLGVPEPTSLRIPSRLGKATPGELVAILAAVFIGQRD